MSDRRSERARGRNVVAAEPMAPGSRQRLAGVRLVSPLFIVRMFVRRPHKADWRRDAWQIPRATPAMPAAKKSDPSPGCAS